MGRSSGAKNHKTLKKVKCDGPMDRQMDRQTDGPTKRVVESRSTRLKMQSKILIDFYVMIFYAKTTWTFIYFAMKNERKYQTSGSCRTGRQK